MADPVAFLADVHGIRTLGDLLGLDLLNEMAECVEAASLEQRSGTVVSLDGWSSRGAS